MTLTNLNIDRGIATVTFANPPRGYMNAAQMQEIDRIADDLTADDAVRVVVFTGGVENVFIRHYDVAEILGFADALQKNELIADALFERARAETALSRTFDKVDRMPKPTIAAINGFCQGGGFEFALCCDLRIAQAGDYRIGLPETNIGIFPGAGGTERLPRLIGEARALELILRGRTVGPEEAARLGLVHECVQGPAIERALELAEELAGKSPRGLAAAKAQVKSASCLSLADGLANGRGRFAALVAGDPEAVRQMKEFVTGGEDINRPE